MASKRKVTLARQQRIPGVRRVQLGGGFHPDVEEIIATLMQKYRVSRSWVIAFYCEVGMFGKASAEHVEDFGAGTAPALRAHVQLRRVK